MLNSPQRIEKEIREKIQRKIDQIGVMARIFSRVKTIESLEKKCLNKNYSPNGKKLQDLIGIRIVLYFEDDIPTARKLVSSIYEEKEADSSIDEQTEQEFKAIRYNLVYEIEESSYKNSVKNFSNTISPILDNTFELQIRTVLSEGWHEVEHDLRYKSSEDWKGLSEHSRMLNGIYATLETCDKSMVRLFDELAYTHYKKKNIEAMIRQKLRLRMVTNSLSKETHSILVSDKELLKELFRVNRKKTLSKMIDMDYWMPLTTNNIIFFINYFFIKNKKLLDITPDIFIDSLS